MSQSELLMLAQQYIGPQMMVVVVSLLLIGYFLKTTPIVKDWAIPWILIAIGIVSAWGLLKVTSIEASIQGILAAGIATLTHQLWKQTITKRSTQEGENLRE